MEPKVTFVMPAYNASRYIREAVESLQRQSRGDWKLIIVDDGSTDDTLALANGFAEKDPRISVVRMPAPSGSAYQPRKRAIVEAETKYVAPLDADDLIEPEYFEKLMSLLEKSGANAVYPTMWSREENGVSTLLTPTDPSLFQKPIAGRECVRYTLDGWKICCGGGIIERELYMKTFERYDSSVTYSRADELITRQLLPLIPLVAFSDARYLYRANTDSITHKKSLKIFDFLNTNLYLSRLIPEQFGMESEEYRLLQNQIFHNIFDALILLDKYQFTPEERGEVYRLIKSTKRELHKDRLGPEASPRYRLLLHLPLPIIRYLLRLKTRTSRF